jgi:predicted RNA-binding protein YlxR (DUF448 family)/ribosomal protein L7Ae-like RNA K-turn-binding protein
MARPSPRAGAGPRDASRRAERGRAMPESATPRDGASDDHVRTCAGCGRRVPDGRDVLVRVVFGPDGAIAVDSGEGSFGRGAYVHPSVDCVRVGGARGLARRRPRPTAGSTTEDAPPRPLEGLTIDGEPLTAESLRRSVVAAYQRRLAGLFAAARRARSVVHGADACCAAIASGESAVVVVAVDAAAAADRTEVRAAVAAGRAVAWGTKQELGELAGAGREDGLAVIAILDARIGLAARDAVHVMDTLRVPFTDTTRAPSDGGTAQRGLVERRA